VTQSLLSELERSYLRDILSASSEIESYIAGLNFEGYCANRTTKLVVERLLQMMTEAASRLGRTAELHCPEVPWRSIRDVGNVLRHAYDRIDDFLIWTAVTVEMPPLVAAVRAALAAPEGSSR
jgi:uncharacterized protein with HEPN domain